MNTNQPSRTGAHLGAGVVVSVLALAAIAASCAAQPPAARPQPPRVVTPTPDAEVELRIRIARSLTTATIEANGPFRITGSDRVGAARWQGAATVTRSAGGFELVGADRSESITLPGPVTLAPLDGNNLLVDGAEHLGSIELRAADQAGAFDAIEIIGIESYLPGVIAAELYPGWSPTAYEAQTITARSYALHERSRRRSEGLPFDLENTTIDQAYAGAKSSPKARQAVERTRGVILRYQGGPLRAYYSSACGGRPASASDTWPTDDEFAFNLAPPLQSRQRPFACGFSHHFNWSVTRDAGDLTGRLAKAGGESGDAIRALRSLESIRATAWNLAGRPALYEVRDRSGQSWRVQADTLRHWCNAAVDGLPEIGRDASVRSGDFDIQVAGETVQITGRGFGHGVGMCQFGAEGFARRGWSRDRILRLYYPGAEIIKAY